MTPRHMQDHSPTAQATHAILSYILYHALYHSVIELQINNEKYVSISQKKLIAQVGKLKSKIIIIR